MPLPVNEDRGFQQHTPSYGTKTHAEVCRWAGVDPKTLSPALPEGPVSPYPDIGLSYRAWRCLSRAGIPATKESVIHALATGALSPGKRPGTYGKATHAEICLWAGVDERTLPSFKGPRDAIQALLKHRG